MSPQSLLFLQTEQIHRTHSFTSDRPAGLQALRVTRPRPAPWLLITQVPSDSTEEPLEPSARQGNDTGCHAAATFARIPRQTQPHRAVRAALRPVPRVTSARGRTAGKQHGGTTQPHSAPSAPRASAPCPAARAHSTALAPPLGENYRSRRAARLSRDRTRSERGGAGRAILARLDGIEAGRGAAQRGAGYGGGFSQHRSSAGSQRQ